MEYTEVSEQVKNLEKKAAPYAQYGQEVEIEQSLDLEPKEYVDLSYTDLLNLYERTQKILSAAGLVGKLSSVKAPAATVAETKEVESKLRQMTSESLEKAQEVVSKPIIELEEKHISPAESGQNESTPNLSEHIEIERDEGHKMEFERELPQEKEGEEEKGKMESMPAEPQKGELDIEKEEKDGQRNEEEREKEEFEIEKEGERERGEKSDEKLEQKETPQVFENEKSGLAEEEKRGVREIIRPKMSEIIRQKRMGLQPNAPLAGASSLTPSAASAAPASTTAPLPQILKETAADAGTKRYEQIEEKIKAALGGATDQIALKKRMLDLTKELFKEKSTSRREEIKLEITILKNMLAGTTLTKKKVSEADAKSSLLDTIITSQQGEVSQIKDSVVDSYRKQMQQMKEKFINDAELAQKEDEKKKLFEEFTSSIVALAKQLPEAIKSYQDFLLKKHGAELQKLGESDDKNVKVKAGERMEYITENYATELSSIKDILAREIDNIVETSGRIVFAETSAESAEQGEKTDEENIIAEINSTSDGSLLHYLKVKGNDIYEKYEKKKLSKVEAILSAKALMAKDRGLKTAAINKYFSKIGGK